MCNCVEEFLNCHRTRFGIILKQQKHKLANKFWKKCREKCETSERSFFINMQEIKQEIVIENDSKIQHDNANRDVHLKENPCKKCRSI